MDEQRHACGPLRDEVEQCGRGLVTEQVGGELDHVRPGQPVQHQVGDRAGPMQRDEQGVSSTPGILRLADTVGEKDQQPATGQPPGQIGQQRLGGRVGPLHVVEQNRDRGAGGRSLKHPTDRFEQPGALQPSVTQRLRREQFEAVEQPGQVGQAIGQGSPSGRAAGV